MTKEAHDTAKYIVITHPETFDESAQYFDTLDAALKWYKECSGWTDAILTKVLTVDMVVHEEEGDGA